MHIYIYICIYIYMYKYIIYIYIYIFVYLHFFYQSWRNKAYLLTYYRRHQLMAISTSPDSFKKHFQSTYVLCALSTYILYSQNQDTNFSTRFGAVEVSPSPPITCTPVNQLKLTNLICLCAHSLKDTELFFVVK